MINYKDTEPSINGWMLLGAVVAGAICWLIIWAIIWMAFL